MEERLKKVKRQQKSISLFRLFLGQIIRLAFDIILEIGICVLILTIALQYEVILPANYAQNYISLHEKQIAKSTNIKKDIPHWCTYGLYDDNKVYQQGNLTNSSQKQANQFLANQEENGSFYSIVKRVDGYCVIHYDLKIHFKNPSLDHMFPQIENALWCFVFIIFLLLIIWNAYSFGIKLKKQFQPLLHLIEQIKEQELEFDEPTTRIKEINDISHALYEMKTALSVSLKKEWELEQQKKNNIQALAHDIKTPLTIMKGNAQLILEEEELAPIYESAHFINQNADKIEEYLKLLMEEMQHNRVHHVKDTMKIKQFLTELEMEVGLFCKSKDVSYSFECKKEVTQINECSIKLSKSRVMRAIMNLLNNAVEYAKTDNQKEKIDVLVYPCKDYICIEITDNGAGFSLEALEHGKEQFFTSHTERQNTHYGLGLYFATEVAKEHDGFVRIQNHKNGGGMVCFALKL